MRYSRAAPLRNKHLSISQHRSTHQPDHPDDLPDLWLPAPRPRPVARESPNRGSVRRSQGRPARAAGDPTRARALRHDPGPRGMWADPDRHTVPGAILYSSYWYRSGVNRTMTENLHGIAQAVESIVPLEAGDLVVDIGCNDGTLLDGYEAEGLQLPRVRPLRRRAVRGREGLRRRPRLLLRRGPSAPAARSEGESDHRRSRCSTTWSSPARVRRRCLPTLLAKGGIWVIELHYLPIMLEANAFDAIVHEHLEYYSLAVIERLLARAASRSSRPSSTTSTAARFAFSSGMPGDHRADPRAGRRTAQAAGQRVRARARRARALRGVPPARRDGARRARPARAS